MNVFRIQGYEALEKRVSPGQGKGSPSSRLYLPPEWAGVRVLVVRLDPIEPQGFGTYTVGSSAGDLVGWTPETLTEALRVPLREIGIAVVCTPRESGGEGLMLNLDIEPMDEELLRHGVSHIVDRVIAEGP